MPGKKRAVRTIPHAVDRKPGVFSRLGLHGFERIAPVLLAALATEEPLLLIGPHGTAKSLLLTRIACALGLSFRHYNASLINFDDLVGFPLPGKNGGLEYVKTPSAIWGAAAVIFDEISRCRPDIQNKLFPIIHERKVQGLPLEGLAYRWAAMNPPSTDENDNGYLGSEPLDTALADRFAFVVTMPPWIGLSEDEQLSVIRGIGVTIDPAVARELAGTLARIREAIPALHGSLADSVSGYVRTVLALLAQGGIALSPRRGAMLFRSILAVHAAALIVDPTLTPSDCTLLALGCGLPQPAQGVPVNETKVLAAHREAWRLAGVNRDDPLRAILLTADPVDRLRLAVAARGLPKGEFSGIVADALSQMPPGSRAAASVHLFDANVAGRLNAAIAEQAALVYGSIVERPKFSESLSASSGRFSTWTRIKDLLSRLDPEEHGDLLHANALAGAFARKEFATPDEAVAFFESYGATAARLRVA